MEIQRTLSRLRREKILRDCASHSNRFQRLTICLLGSFSAASVIPTLSAKDAQLYAAIAPWVQVVGLADAFDALIHPRVYKPAYQPWQAVDMIVSGACGAFDPAMLDCFTRSIGLNYGIMYV